MSNALWKGVPLPKVLEASRAKSNVEAILFHAADGYYETFRSAKQWSRQLCLLMK